MHQFTLHDGYSIEKDGLVASLEMGDNTILLKEAVTDKIISSL